jgi:hypothetical protein
MLACDSCLVALCCGAASRSSCNWYPALHLAANFKVCAASSADNCPDNPPLPPDEDDPQCVDKLPWACCTTCADSQQQCSLLNPGSCEDGSVNPNGYCEDSKCRTYQINVTKTSFTFYSYQNRFDSVDWPDRACGPQQGCNVSGEALAHRKDCRACPAHRQPKPWQA